MEPPRASIREVANHVKALETGLARLAEIPICSRLIRELHAILLATVRGGENSKTPGEFRRSQNWIGRPGSNLETATFVPPPPHDIDQLLSNWENYLHSESEEPDLIKAALLPAYSRFCQTSSHRCRRCAGLTLWFAHAFHCCPRLPLWRKLSECVQGCCLLAEAWIGHRNHQSTPPSNLRRARDSQAHPAKTLNLALLPSRWAFKSSP